MSVEILEGMGVIVGLVLTYAKVTNDYSKIKRENLLKDIEIYQKVGGPELRERILQTMKKSVKSLYPRVDIKHYWPAFIAMPVYLGGAIYFVLNYIKSPVYSLISLLAMFVALEILKRSTLTNFFSQESEFYLRSEVTSWKSNLHKRNK